ncbi:hypothetical protein SELMODRAFT_403695 [Selaginella moellendorffii]|uniref:Uncharacterized protein n=1 Tax=Selaginella moellendorffii TaxID=88036 RepID=D8QS83_SELML|nr:hypothetical protein SELMODRAFT_403695 [Selaginella moellendorffii]
MARRIANPRYYQGVVVCPGFGILTLAGLLLYDHRVITQSSMLLASVTTNSSRMVPAVHSGSLDTDLAELPRSVVPQPPITSEVRLPLTMLDFVIPPAFMPGQLQQEQSHHDITTASSVSFEPQLLLEIDNEIREAHQPGSSENEGDLTPYAAAELLDALTFMGDIATPLFCATGIEKAIIMTSGGEQKDHHGQMKHRKYWSCLRHEVYGSKLREASLDRQARELLQDGNSGIPENSQMQETCMKSLTWCQRRKFLQTVTSTWKARLLRKGKKLGGRLCQAHRLDRSKRRLIHEAMKESSNDLRTQIFELLDQLRMAMIPILAVYKVVVAVQVHRPLKQENMEGVEFGEVNKVRVRAACHTKCPTSTHAGDIELMGRDDLLTLTVGRGKGCKSSKLWSLYFASWDHRSQGNARSRVQDGEAQNYLETSGQGCAPIAVNHNTLVTLLGQGRAKQAF